MRCAALILLVLAGCASTPDVPRLPEIVRVPVETIVPVPAALTAPCDEVAKADNTIGEAIRLANARLASLQACNKRLAEIRELGRKP